MSIKDKLQIILITYNRAGHVENTFKQILDEKSPVKDYNILVLDNNSTDTTRNVVEEWQKKYPKLKYQKNKYNIGISGNIAKAMEIADRQYLWIIADDDKYDFSNWSEVENAINNNEKIICISRYAYQENTDTMIECQIGQLTFIPAIIFNTSEFNDSVMRNAFDNIYTLFPHLIPVINFLNNGGKIYVTQKPIVENGMDLKTDCSYTRGHKNSEICNRSRKMQWMLGFCEVMSYMKDEKLKQKTLITNAKFIHGSLNKFYSNIVSWYQNDINLLFDILTQIKGFPRYIILYKYIMKKIYLYKKIKIDEYNRKINLLCGLFSFKYRKKSL